MGKITKIIMACFMLTCSCLGFSPSASSGKEEIDMEFKGKVMSAELEGVSLRLVLEKLGKEKGIWFRGDESVLDEEVSIRFMDLPLHEGLRRILSNINHVLVFDEGKGLVGLFIIGKKNTASRTSRDAAIVTGKSLPSRPAKEDTASEDPFGIFLDAGHAGNPKTRSRDGAIGKNFSPLEDQNTKMGDTPFTDTSSVPGNPFGEDASSSPENPLAESVPSSSDNPFDGHIAPSSGDPSVDPLGLFRESPKGKD